MQGLLGYNNSRDVIMRRVEKNDRKVLKYKDTRKSRGPEFEVLWTSPKDFKFRSSGISTTFIY